MQRHVIVDFFIVIVGVILLRRSFNGPWVNRGLAVKALSLDAWNSPWDIDCGKCLAMLHGHLALAMAPTLWNLLLLFGICGCQLLDKQFLGNDALTLPELA